MTKQKLSITIMAVIVCVAGFCSCLTSCSENQPIEARAVPEEQKNDVKTITTQDIGAFLSILNENTTMLAYTDPGNGEKSIEIVDNAQVSNRLEIIIFAMGLAGKLDATLTGDTLVCTTSNPMEAVNAVNKILNAGGCAKVCKNSKGEYLIYKCG